jgi:SNF2 family DNA or RNA helicase
MSTKLPRDWHLLTGSEMRAAVGDLTMEQAAKILPPGLRAYFIQNELGVSRLAEIHVHRTHLPLLEGYQHSRGQATQQVLGLSPAQRAWLRPYQIEDVGFVTSRAGTIVASDLGIGKSAIASASCGEAYTVIVCPASAICVWEAESRRMGWTHRVLSKRSKRVELRAGAHNDVQTLIISYNLLPALAGSMVLGSEWQTHTLIADEAHQLTNKKTTWASMFRMIHRERTILLTATPMRNRLRSLWGLLDCAVPAAFGKEYDFRRRYTGAKQGSYGLEDHEPTNQTELALRLTECVIKRTRAQVDSPLPAHTRSVMECEVSGHELRTALESLQDAGKAQRQADALRCLGAMRLAIGRAKARMVVGQVAELVEAHGRVILWVWHHEVAAILRKGLEQLEVPVDVLLGDTHTQKRAEIVEEWRNGDASRPRVLIASIGAAATAISLTTAKAAVFVELDWTPMNLIQAEKRHYRFGNVFKDITTIYVVSQVGSDRQMLQALFDKAEASEVALGVDGSLEQMRILLGESETIEEDLVARWTKGIV